MLALTSVTICLVLSCVVVVGLLTVDALEARSMRLLVASHSLHFLSQRFNFPSHSTDHAYCLPRSDWCFAGLLASSICSIRSLKLKYPYKWLGTSDFSSDLVFSGRPCIRMLLLGCLLGCPGRLGVCPDRNPRGFSRI